MFYYNSLIVQKNNNEKDFEAAEVAKDTIYGFIAENLTDQDIAKASTMLKGLYPEGRDSEMLTFIFLRDDSSCGAQTRIVPDMSNKELLCNLAMKLNESFSRKGIKQPVLVNIERENLTMDFSKMDFHMNKHPLFDKDELN